MLLHSNIYEMSYRICRGIINEIFKVSLTTYLLFYLLDTLFSGFVSDYLNLTYLLSIAIISGVITVIIMDTTTINDHDIDIQPSGYILFTFLSLLTMILVYLRISSMGRISYAVALLCGILAFIIMYLIFNKKENNHE